MTINDISDEIIQREHARKQDTSIEGTYSNWFALYTEVIDQRGDEAEIYLKALLEDGAYDGRHIQKLAIRAAIARTQRTREHSAHLWEGRRSWAALGLSALAIVVATFS